MRFKEHENFYLDIKTGIHWSKFTICNTTWEESMTLAPTGWRLPTIAELLAIVDHTHHNPATELPNMTSNYYWSSITYIYYRCYSWHVDFRNGYDYYGLKSSKYNARYIKED